jgi:hypothetical protein
LLVIHGSLPYPLALSPGFALNSRAMDAEFSPTPAIFATESMPDRRELASKCPIFQAVREGPELD